VLDAVGSGVAANRQMKAVFSGVANPVVRERDLDTPLSYEGFQSIGSGMGAAGFIVYDDTACMLQVARQFSRFLWIESCGQCPPCKLGSGDITENLERLEAGVGDVHELGEIGAWLEKVTDANRCFLGTEERLLVGSILGAFPEEIVEHIEAGRCPRPRSLTFPKLVDLADGTATYDESIARKQPDWTYAPA
jgi:NADH-quinone oxidoreductase subunit F